MTLRCQTGEHAPLSCRHALHRLPRVCHAPRPNRPVPRRVVHNKCRLLPFSTFTASAIVAQTCWQRCYFAHAAPFVARNGEFRTAEAPPPHIFLPSILQTPRACCRVRPVFRLLRRLFTPFPADFVFRFFAFQLAAHAVRPSRPRRFAHSIKHRHEPRSARCFRRHIAQWQRARARRRASTYASRDVATMSFILHDAIL